MTSFFIFLTLAVIAWIDFTSHVIPDNMLLILLICGIFRNIQSGTVLLGIAGFLICGTSMLLLAASLSNGDIGGGDIKLCAVIGAILGPLDSCLVILSSLIFLSVWGIFRRKTVTAIPFAPFVFPVYIVFSFLQKGMI